MKWRHTDRSAEDYQQAPARIQRAFDKQVRFLGGNLLNSSLHAKKFSESEDVWQARGNRDWRFYFKIAGDTYVIVRIIPHPK
jgi:hypothetical protein